MNEVLQELQRIDRRVEQVEVIERPGVTGLNTFYLGGTSFTPIFGGSTGDGTFTYSIQVGRYLRVGSLCFFRLALAAATRTSAATGDARIGPLPFTSVNVTNAHVPVVLDTLEQINVAATTVQLSARVPPNTAYVEFIENPDAGSVTFLPASVWLATSAIRISGWYEIA